MMRTVSYGGGVQSTALLVLAAQGVIDFPVFLFANVGEKSELPETLRYVRDIAMPYAAAHGLDVIEVQRHPTRTKRVDLYDTMVDYDGDRLSEPIPVRGENGAPMHRSCTADWKIAPIGDWLTAHGATSANPATVAIGISTDELERAGNGKDQPYERRTYPLLDLGLSRSACQKVIADAGLPVPPKSACWFCPFHRPGTWAETRRDDPERFWQSVKLERLLNERRDVLGKDHVYLTRFGRPLDEAIAEAQPSLFGEEGPEGCDEGHCWT